MKQYLRSLVLPIVILVLLLFIWVLIVSHLNFIPVKSALKGMRFSALFLIILFISNWIITVVFCVKKAKKLNQSKIMWGLLGFLPYLIVLLGILIWFARVPSFFGFLFFASIITLIILVWKQIAAKWQQIAAKRKQCPYCGGIIPIEAKKCKHCSEWLDTAIKNE
jgi:hypothetical protein